MAWCIGPGDVINIRWSRWMNAADRWRQLGIGKYSKKKKTVGTRRRTWWWTPLCRQLVFAIKSVNRRTLVSCRQHLTQQQLQLVDEDEVNFRQRHANAIWVRKGRGSRMQGATWVALENKKTTFCAKQMKDICIDALSYWLGRQAAPNQNLFKGYSI